MEFGLRAPRKSIEHVVSAIWALVMATTPLVCTRYTHEIGSISISFIYAVTLSTSLMTLPRAVPTSLLSRSRSFPRYPCLAILVLHDLHHEQSPEPSSFSLNFYGLTMTSVHADVATVPLGVVLRISLFLNLDFSFAYHLAIDKSTSMTISLLYHFLSLYYYHHYPHTVLTMASFTIFEDKTSQSLDNNTNTSPANVTNIHSHVQTGWKTLSVGK
jgi:hypothetical protein